MQYAGHKRPLRCRLSFQKAHAVTSLKLLRKTLDQVAANNESAAIVVMRAAERTGDEVLRQQLHRVIQQMNQDALTLRALRDAQSADTQRRA